MKCIFNRKVTREELALVDENDVSLVVYCVKYDKVMWEYCQTRDCLYKKEKCYLSVDE